MKNKNNKIVIGTLSGLLLFVSSLALMFYTDKDTLTHETTPTLEVFVAAKKIEKGSYIDADSLKRARIAKQFLPQKPLLDTEIVGRYANVDIYKDEPFRIEKLSDEKPREKKAAPQQPKQLTYLQEDIQDDNKTTSDTLTLPLSLFKNIDPTLRKGDVVDIVSVTYTQNKERQKSFATKYVAIQIPIHAFIMDNQQTTDYLQKDAEGVAHTAQNITLKLTPKEIKNLLALYYKTQALNQNRVYNTNNYGGQLWLVKSSKTLDTAILKMKENMLFDRKTYVKPKKHSKPKVSISYEN